MERRSAPPLAPKDEDEDEDEHEGRGRFFPVTREPRRAGFVISRSRLETCA